MRRWIVHFKKLTREVMQACGGTLFSFGRRSAVECLPAED
jgi:hypothetical protein